MSKRIQQLESQLGSKLFDRHNRTVSLTEAGHTLLPKAQQIIDLIRDTEKQIENTSGKVSGRLFMATSHHIGLHRLPPILKRFVQSYPDVNLDIRFMGSEDAFEAVRQRQIELALTTLDDEVDAIITRQSLWQDNMLCICSKDHPLKQIKNPSLKDFSQFPAVLPEQNTITYQLIRKIFKQQGLMLKSHMPTNYLETIKMMVSVGLGWSLLPESMIEKKDKSIVQLVWPSNQPTRDLGSIYLTGRTLSNAASAFIKLLQEQENA